MKKLFANGKWSLTIAVVYVIFNSFTTTISAIQQNALSAQNCQVLLMGIVVWLIFRKPEDVYHYHEYEADDGIADDNDPQAK